MKKSLTLGLALLFAAGCAFAQQPTAPSKQPQTDGQHHHHHHDGNHPHHHHDGQRPERKPAAPTYNADGIDMAIVGAFPTVKSLKPTDKWIEVYDAKKQLLGYALYSKPASDSIKGFNGETPLLIAFDTQKKVCGVYLLGNIEGPRFVQMVTDGGLFKQWNGLDIKSAHRKKVDAVSGATYTSNGVIRSFQAAVGRL